MSSYGLGPGNEDPNSIPNQFNWGGQPSQPQWPTQPVGYTPWGGNDPSAQYNPWQPGPGPGPGPGPQSQGPTREIPSGLQDKSLITLNIAVSPNPKHFAVDLSSGKDIYFHFNVRFDDGGQKVIVMNSCFKEKWGHEEKIYNKFPFTPGQYIELKILCEDKCFKVAVNNTHLCEFKHREKPKHICALGVYKDANLMNFSLTKLP
ncbi:galectin-3b [Thalassophryne amazonica]|uniref:galectin-3b n=1 Tax=Thalassophryne amazonica TaxID=390379 RepID=UPI001471D293|nr:galectin-3b [Thalassophryne amazonica]